MNAKDISSQPNGANRPAHQFYRPEGYDPNESVGYLMRRILSTVSQQVERELEPTGLTNAQWLPLLKLYMGAANTAAELARCSDMDAGAMTRLLDRLEAKGLCRRTRSSSDRRVVNLELTPEGVESARSIPGVLCDVQNSLLSDFSTEEWQMLKGLLRRVLANAQAVGAQASGTDKAFDKSDIEKTNENANAIAAK